MFDSLNPWYVLVALVGVLVVLRVIRGVRHRRQRLRPATLHPKLQKYAGPQQITAERRREAAKIVATSTTPEIAGYHIVEQVEAVFVDGFSRPEEAIEGLKAVAAMKGANALANVRQERTTSGRCSAGGDAVKVVREGGPAPHTAEPPQGPPSSSVP